MIKNWHIFAYDKAIVTRMHRTKRSTIYWLFRTIQGDSHICPMGTMRVNKPMKNRWKLVDYLETKPLKWRSRHVPSQNWLLQCVRDDLRLRIGWCHQQAQCGQHTQIYFQEIFFEILSDWCAILIAHQLLWQNMEVPVSIFQESPLAGEPRERLFHIHSVHRYQLCTKYLYPSTLLWQINCCNLKQQPGMIHWCYLFRCWKFNDV